MIHKTIVLIILNEMNSFNELFSETNDFFYQTFEFVLQPSEKNICLLNEKIEKAESLDSFENIFTLIMHF